MSDDHKALLEEAKSGSPKALQQLLVVHRPRLRKMVSIRLHPMVKTRVDESDILQDALLDASMRIGDYFEKCSMPFFLWLRFITNQKIQQCHRQHLDTKKRSTRRHRQTSLEDSASVNMADQLVSRESTPSSILVSKESVNRVRIVLNSLNETDREILCLRHFEQLSNAEVAETLDIPSTNASSRYLRALAKLQKGLESLSQLAPEQEEK